MALSGYQAGLFVAGPLILNYPYTFCAWCRLTVAPSADQAIAAQYTANTQDCDATLTITAAGAVEALVAVGASTAAAVASATLTTNVWAHCAAVFTSTSSRTAYQDGAHVVTDATLKTPGAVGFFNVGINEYNGLVQGAQTAGMDVAHIAVWNIALTAADIAQLGTNRVSPLRVRPDALLAYWPMLGWTQSGGTLERDIVGRAVLSGGPSIPVASNPPVFLPNRSRAPLKLVAPAAGPAPSPTVVVSINGSTANTNKIRLSSLRIEDFISQYKMAYLSATVAIAAGADIKVGLGDVTTNLVFAGVARTASQQYEQVKSNLLYAVTCQDYSYLLNRRRPIKSYVNQPASAVIADLLANFSTGFSGYAVRGNATSITATFDGGQDWMTCARAVADAAGASVYVDAFKDVHFFVTETLPSPATIDASNIISAVGARNLAKTDDFTQLTTRYFVRGGGSPTTAAVSAGTTTIPVNDTSWYAATGGSVISPEADIITYTGVSAASGPGNLTGIPSTGAGRIINAIKQSERIAVWAQRDNASAQATIAALESGDGIHENVVSDATLTDAQARDRGDQLLAISAGVLTSLSYATRDLNTRSGAIVTVNLGAPTNISVSETIQQVTLTDFGIPNVYPLRTVQAVASRISLSKALSFLFQQATKVG